jgi:nitrogen fixation/metabolism regulation signal transduction histidine kinase
MKKNKKKREEDEEVRRAKANIRTGFIIAVVVIALFAIVAAVMLGMLSWGFDCDIAKIG